MISFYSLISHSRYYFHLHKLTLYHFYLSARYALHQLVSPQPSVTPAYGMPMSDYFNLDCHAAI